MEIHRSDDGLNGGDAAIMSSPPHTCPAARSSGVVKPAISWFVIALLWIMAPFIGTPTSIVKASSNQPAKVQSAAPGKSTMLAMVYIRVASPGSLKQLRAMPIDIIRVRPDPSLATDKSSLGGGLIVEAVVPRDFMPKLKAAGFEISEIPQK